MAKSTRQGVLFDGIFPKPLHVHFDAEGQSSEGGVALLAAADRRLGLTARLAGEITDPRQPGKVVHETLDLLRQRVYGLGLGYPDVRDADRLASDPCLKQACDRGPLADGDLASAATLCRFENQVTAREAARLSRGFEDGVIARVLRRHRHAPRLVLDFDPAVDKTHGEQQGTLFNGYYRSWCYLPMFGFLTAEGSGENHLVWARLRPGNAMAPRGFVPTLRRLVRKLRAAFGCRKQILVRLDSAFARPIVLDALDELGVKYVVAAPTNPMFKRWAKRWQSRVRRRARESGRAERLFTERRHRAVRWDHTRRVILKAEAIPYPGRALKDNPRFVYTNLNYRPETVYRIYCQRGEVENRIKELKQDLEIDRTSCHDFVANQVRVVLTAAAYVLMQELRWHLRRTHLARAQVGRLRLCLLKIGAHLQESVRRVVVHLPAHFPYVNPWRAAAASLGAT